MIKLIYTKPPGISRVRETLTVVQQLPHVAFAEQT